VSVRLSVCLSHLVPPPRRAAGLLLWFPRDGDINRLLHGVSAAGAAAFRYSGPCNSFYCLGHFKKKMMMMMMMMIHIHSSTALSTAANASGVAFRAI